MILPAKNIIKATALVCLGLAIYMAIAKGAFNPVAICTAIGGLFGVNSAHEYFNGDDEK